MLNRIAIIGVPGAGKSTFATELGSKLGRKVIHLDKEYHLPNWERRYSKIGWVELMKKMVQKEGWIIDGDYPSTLDMRLEAADVIVYFNLSKWLCIWGAVRRFLSPGNMVDKPEGMKEKVSYGLIKRIVYYPTDEIQRKLDIYRDNGKQVIELRKRGEVEKAWKWF